MVVDRQNQPLLLSVLSQTPNQMPFFTSSSYSLLSCPLSCSMKTIMSYTLSSFRFFSLGMRSFPRSLLRAAPLLQSLFSQGLDELGSGMLLATSCSTASRSMLTVALQFRQLPQEARNFYKLLIIRFSFFYVPSIPHNLNTNMIAFRMRFAIKM